MQWPSRWACALLLALGCNPSPSRPTVSPAPPTPAPEPIAAPPRAPADERAPVASKRPSVRIPVEPEFEPLALSEEQLARARKFQPLVQAAAKAHGVDANLLNGMIWHESKFNPKARNRSGAKGLMQLMPKTGQAMARALGRRFRPYDPEFSIQAGAKLMSILLGKFEQDEELALFGYARGGGRVRKYQREGGEIPQGVLKFIAHVRQAQRTFAELGFPGRQPATPRRTSWSAARSCSLCAPSSVPRACRAP